MTEDRPGFVNGDIIRCKSVTDYWNDPQIARRIDGVDLLMAGAVKTDSPLRGICKNYVGREDPVIDIVATYHDGREVSVILNRAQAKQLIRDIRDAMKLTKLKD
ncbi:MAG: hypothetical protein PHF83_05440 [Candidatus Methanomethylophilus sp.]|nr:hypothetical protein [Methanomethylophilus sp.]